MSELRTEFERLHPVPDYLRWTPTHYAVKGNCYEYEACRMYNALWQGFQSGHAAGLEDAAKECERPTADGTMYVHYGVRHAAAAIRAMKEPK